MRLPSCPQPPLCAQPHQFGLLDNASALGELTACHFNLLWFGARPPKLGAYNAAPGLELAVPSQLVPNDLEARTDPLLDHAALELGESACDLEEQLAMWRGGVEVLLIEVEVDANRLEVLDCLQQVGQGPPQPVYRPGHDDVEPAPSGILEHGVEPWSLISACVRMRYHRSMGVNCSALVIRPRKKPAMRAKTSAAQWALAWVLAMRKVVWRA